MWAWLAALSPAFQVAFDLVTLRFVSCSFFSNTKPKLLSSSTVLKLRSLPLLVNLEKPQLTPGTISSSHLRNDLLNEEIPRCIL